MTDCCRAPVGADKKFLDALSEVLTEVENRPMDKIVMDLTVPTKRALYHRLVKVSERISFLLQKDTDDSRGHL